MFEDFNHLINRIELTIRAWLNFDHSNPRNWNRQAQPASGPLTGKHGETRQGVREVNSALSKKYTADEVKRYLRGLDGGVRVQPVMAEAARFSSMLNDKMRRHFRGRERIFERLPYVLYQYTKGAPSQEIARSVSYFSDADDVEQAMYFAARLIAAKVNRDHR